MELKPQTIGIINFLDGIESSDRLKSTATLAAKDLGWEVLQCDGKGTPAQFVACGNQLLDRGVAGIIEIAIEPGQIQPVLDKANAKKIPVIQVGGGSVPERRPRGQLRAGRDARRPAALRRDLRSSSGPRAATSPSRTSPRRGARPGPTRSARTSRARTR